MLSAERKHTMFFGEYVVTKGSSCKPESSCKPDSYREVNGVSLSDQTKPCLSIYCNEVFGLGF